MLSESSLSFSLDNHEEKDNDNTDNNDEEEDDDDDDEEDEHGDIWLANARDHSYLPGISHPLTVRHGSGHARGNGSRTDDSNNNDTQHTLHSSSIALSSSSSVTATATLPSLTTTLPTTTTTTTRSRPFSLICWQTKDFVLMPGATLPLRLETDHSFPSHQRALDGLKRQIATSRKEPGKVPSVYLGILYYQHHHHHSNHNHNNSNHHNNSNNRDSSSSEGSDELERTGTTHQQHEQQHRQRRRTRSFTMDQDSSSSSSSNSSSNSSSSGSEEETNNHHRHIHQHRRRRRQRQRRQQRLSWTRLGMGPNRLRRLSERVQRELQHVDWQVIATVAGQDDDHDDDDEQDDENETEEDQQIITHPNHNHNHNRNHSNDTNSTPISSNHARNDTPTAAAATTAEIAAATAAVVSPPIRPRRRQRDRQQQQQQQQQQQTLSSPPPPPPPPPPPRRRTRRDPWHGQIGTLVTITYTHEPDNNHNNNNNNMASSSAPLILTARAVGRFRVLDRHQMEHDPYAHARRSYGSRGSGHLLQCMVEEWPFEKVMTTLPPSCINNAAKTAATRAGTTFLGSLSLPPYQWQPTTLLQALKARIQRIPSLAGLLMSPSSQKHKHKLSQQNPNYSEEQEVLNNPILFSYWMATNLPSLQLRQKIRILQMPTAAERLLYLHRVVKALERQEEVVLHCGRCQLPLARARQIFTVGGAEGTTGAYVNPHGVVHETLTVQHLDLLQDEADVWLLGGPEIRDSWFPGYAWTIANCALCGSHLGWKFDRVATSHAGRTARPSRDRPDQFFGLRAGQILSKVPQSPPMLPRSEEETDRASL